MNIVRKYNSISLIIRIIIGLVIGAILNVKRRIFAKPVSFLYASSE